MKLIADYLHNIFKTKKERKGKKKNSKKEKEEKALTKV